MPSLYKNLHLPSLVSSSRATRLKRFVGEKTNVTQGFDLNCWTIMPFTKPENIAGRDQNLQGQVVGVVVEMMQSV